jgi:hypothetical protein
VVFHAVRLTLAKVVVVQEAAAGPRQVIRPRYCGLDGPRVLSPSKWDALKGVPYRIWMLHTRTSNPEQ